MKRISLAFVSVGAFLTPLGLPKPEALDIHKYRSWTVVNRVPVKMSMAVAQLCAIATKKQMASMDPSSPHKDYFLRVFVNREGRSQFLHKAAPTFPVGSIIVKEKLPDIDSTHPELLTVMRKRENGYDAKHGNWEYAVVDRLGKLSEQGALPRCISCHEGQSKTDFVYRSYFQVK